MLIRRTYQLDQEPHADAVGNINPDLAGYPTTDALVQGYRNSSQEAQRWRERALALEAEAANQRPQIPDRNQNPYDRLTEFGLPADALREAVQKEIQQAFQPITRGLTARSQVLGQYPDYTKFEADVANFINSDPNMQQAYNNMFNADPVGAMEYAFLKFGENRRRTQPADAAKNGDRQEAAHAKIPSGRSGESRKQQETGGDDVAAKAWEHYQKTNDPRPFAKARLRQAIPDSFFQG